MSNYGATVHSGLAIELQSVVHQLFGILQGHFIATSIPHTRLKNHKKRGVQSRIQTFQLLLTEYLGLFSSNCKPGIKILQTHHYALLRLLCRIQQTQFVLHVRYYLFGFQ